MAGTGWAEPLCEDFAWIVAIVFNGDHLGFEPVHERTDPGREPGFKGVGINQHEHTSEPVVRRDAVRQL